MVITSPRNPRIVAAARLQRSKARRDAGRTLLEGPHLLEAAVAAGGRIEVVFALAGDAAIPHVPGADMVEVTQQVLERLAPTEHPRGPVAVMAIPDPSPPTGRDALVVWGVADPGNVGTLIRTAAAFGLDAVVGPGCADPWSPKVLRAAAGAHFATTVAANASLADLRSVGLTLAAAVVSGGVPVTDLPDAPLGVLVGSEAHGLPAEVIDECDLRVSIPMPGGIESLNVAVAGAIVAYEMGHRR
jgi:RNA methyltransferase, TrmH family